MHLKGDPLKPISFVQQDPVSNDLIGQQGGGAIEDGDLHFSIGQVVQRDHQFQLSLHRFSQPQIRVQENGDVHVAEVAGPTARH